jgi:hypothetical protein
MCSRGIAFTNLLKLIDALLWYRSLKTSAVSYGLWQHGTCSLRRNGHSWEKGDVRITDLV